jgi:hypothetical protein
MKYDHRFAGEELSEDYCVLKKQGFPVTSGVGRHLI